MHVEYYYFSGFMVLNYVWTLIPVTTVEKEHSLSLRERARERGYKNRQLAQSYPLSPTLSRRERE